MSWLLITISSYFILAVVFLADKYLLTGSISNPKVYTFYVGILGIFFLILVPFVGFSMPGIFQIALAVFGGAIFIFACFWLFKGLQLFEASRIIPAIGGFVPLFTLGLTYLFSSGKETLSFYHIAAFILLVFGSILISLERIGGVSLDSLRISILAAFLFSLSLIFSKYAYLGQSFWSVYVWINIGGFLMAVCFFIFSKEVRNGILKRDKFFSKKTAAVFFLTRGMGVGANILQNWAIFLVPLAYVAMINALQGTQYAFLLVLTVLISVARPLWAERAGLKEEVSRGVIVLKVIAVLFIVMGLAILAFSSQ